MKKVSITLVFGLMVFFVSAQEPDFSSIDVVMKSFYDALSTDNPESRSKKLAKLFTIDGQITSVNHVAHKPASIKNGSWKSFFSGSTSLYTSFKVSNDEVERSADYYGEIASVQGLVYQTLTSKSNGKTYAQLYWMQIDLVFYNNRWYIDYASWTNQYQNTNVEEAILSDTIWHQLSQ
jgi:hypothetical protein